MSSEPKTKRNPDPSHAAPSTDLTHLDARGHVHMVDVGDKPATRRVAVAAATVRMSLPAAVALRDGGIKGDALATARVAGILAAKDTPRLIPLCHSLPLDHVRIDIEVDTESGLAQVRARCETTHRTGVEMEAMVAASTAALTLYDMVKAVDRGMVIESVRLLRKEGGRSGTWVAPGGDGGDGPGEGDRPA